MQVCNEPQILDIILIAKTGMILLQYLAPLVVILFASIDVIKGVTAKDQDSINKAIGMIPKRLIAMAILFFVPMCIDFTMQVADESFDYATCFAEASRENIDNLYNSIATEKILYATSVANDFNAISAEIKNAHDEAAIAILKMKDLEKQKEYIAQNAENLKKYEEQLKKEKEASKTAKDVTFRPKNNSNSSGMGVGSGTIPQYNQAGESWSSIPYGQGNIGTSGCGATSLAMIIAGLGDSSVNPGTVAQKIAALGLPQTTVSHVAFTSPKLLGPYGVIGELLSDGNGNKSQVMPLVREKLEAGYPLIINVLGHYLVADSLCSDGTIHINNTGPKGIGCYNDDDFWENIVRNWDKRYGTAQYGYPFYTFFWYRKG